LQNSLMILISIPDFDFCTTGLGCFFFISVLNYN
jgi:hypothetical protein